MMQGVKIFDNNNNPVTFQPRNAKAVVANDSTVFQPSVLFIGTTGSVKVRTANGDDITFVNVADSFILPVLVDMVYSTGTTCTNMVRMY